MNKYFDGKYNALLDNMAFRLGLLVAGFGVWLVVGVSVLKLSA